MRTFITPPRHEVLYIGVDVHKDTHTAVAINAFGEKFFEKVISNSKEDFQTLVTTAKAVSSTHSLFPVFGLEDSYGNGIRLARYISSQNIMVKMVPPVLTDVFRKYETHPEKNDSLDAFAAAKVLIQRIDTLPSYTLTKQDELSKEIKELALDREFLIKEQTRIKNQLHRLLHKAYNGEYRKKFKDPFSVKALKSWKTHPIPSDMSDIPGDATILKHQIKRKVKRLMDIREETKELEGELKTLMERTGQKLTTLNGCGTVLAAKVMAEIRDAKRFYSPSALAKYAGLCPRERSSGNTFRHVKTKAGNRRLNMAIHRIALSQISRSGNQEAKTYFQKKISEGKTKGQALCCLKRRLIDIVYMMLKYQQSYRYQP
jgi:transposase